MPYNETYQTDPVLAYAGMLADLGEQEIVSRDFEESADDGLGIGFGLPVVQGTGDRQCDRIGAGATEVLGITVRDQALRAEDVNVYAQHDNVPLLREGVMWVTVTDAGGVVAGDPVWVTLATGAFSNADVGSGGGLHLTGSRWESTAANGDLAKVRFNLDVPAVAGAA